VSILGPVLLLEQQLPRAAGGLTPALMGFIAEIDFFQSIIPLMVHLRASLRRQFACAGLIDVSRNPTRRALMV